MGKIINFPSKRLLDDIDYIIQDRDNNPYWIERREYWAEYVSTHEYFECSLGNHYDRCNNCAYDDSFFKMYGCCYMKDWDKQRGRNAIIIKGVNVMIKEQIIKLYNTGFDRFMIADMLYKESKHSVKMSKKQALEFVEHIIYKDIMNKFGGVTKQ